MELETQHAIHNMTTTEIGMICLTLIILVVAPCITWLLYKGKLSNLSWKMGKGLNVEAADNGNGLALQFLEKLLDEAEYTFKRKMLAIANECFKDNPRGKEHAMSIIALNHCTRDIASTGFDTYMAQAKQMGGWSDEEAEGFAKGLLAMIRTMVDARLDAYGTVRHFKSSNSFQQILQTKIDKNLGYSTMLNRYLDKNGMGSTVIESGHELRSRILQREETLS